MEVQMGHQFPYERRKQLKNKPRGAKWVKEWVPQDLASAGGKCLVLKWVREDMLKILKERCKEHVSEEREPEPTTEVLFLCSFEGCGKTFIDAGALRKHSHIHGERQYICQYEGCGKKFLDSSKLKRHHLIHTGQRDYICPHEGCGKAFSLDFNLRAHMRTHTQENYRSCPYQDCGKKYAHDYKLQAHIRSYHEKNAVMNVTKHTPSVEKSQSFSKPSAAIYGSALSDRPYACPYEGCDKAYIHEYKLNLHLKREHPGHNHDERVNCIPTLMVNHHGNGAAEEDTYAGRVTSCMSYRSGIQNLVRNVPPTKLPQKDTVLLKVDHNTGKWHAQHMYKEDSEETEEEDCDNTEDERWCDRGGNDDDEETEDED